MKREILVVEDQPGIRLLLFDVFTRMGHQVTVAETGTEGLGKIHKGKFDLLMLDYRLPQMNGYEIIERMERDKIFIPIIMMSGLLEEIPKDQFDTGMIVKWMAKPFNLQELCEIVQDVLKKHTFELNGKC